MYELNNILALVIENDLKELDIVIDELLQHIDIKLTFIDAKYAGDKLRDMNLINEINEEMRKLTKIVESIKSIEVSAIEINNMVLYTKCESRISKIINMMEYIKSKYLL